MTNRQLFLSHVGQTSPAPLCLEIVKAEGCSLTDINGKVYLDLIGGISVCNVGHRNEKVIQAIRDQVDKYLHIMVYGELVENPQVQYAKLLTEHLPPALNAVYFTASGSEATEGAMKLAKRVSNRTRIISFKNSYHGSTQGALSVMGSEYWQQAFRPLLPDILQLQYNSHADLENITTGTACVIAETIQAEAGVNKPDKEWMRELRKKCDETGTLLILDEIQCGFGRNGTLWAFEQFGIVPDILLLGKALGGGMPMGAFIADKKYMDSFTHNPVLGHITTFGGHPVCCAAGMAAFRVLVNEQLVESVHAKEALFLTLLKSDQSENTSGAGSYKHAKIKAVRSCGLMIAVEFEDGEMNKKVIDRLISNGVFTDWYLFSPECLRIAPPLTISEEEIRFACMQILDALDHT